MSRRARIALYTLFTVVMLLAALLLTFPYDALGRRLEAEFARRFPGSTLVINEIGPALPFGVRLADIVITRPGKDEAVPNKIEIERIRLRPALLSLFLGKAGIAFSIDILSGRIDGAVLTGAGGHAIKATFDHLQLEDGKLFESMTGLQMEGGLNGKLEVAATKDGQVTTGNIDASLAAAKVKGGKVAGFTAPAIDLGTPQLLITIDKGEATIAKFDTQSPDIELTTKGSASLRPELMTSIVRGSIKMKFTEPFLTKTPTVRGAMGLAGPFKKSDGSLEFPLNGSLARPIPFNALGR